MRLFDVAVLEEEVVVQPLASLKLRLGHVQLRPQLNHLRVRAALENHQLLHRVPVQVFVLLGLLGLHGGALLLLVGLPGPLLRLLHPPLLILAHQVHGQSRGGRRHRRGVLEAAIVGRGRRHPRRLGQCARHLERRLHLLRSGHHPPGTGHGRSGRRLLLEGRPPAAAAGHRGQARRQRLALERPEDQVLRHDKLLLVQFSLVASHQVPDALQHALVEPALHEDGEALPARHKAVPVRVQLRKGLAEPRQRLRVHPWRARHRATGAGTGGGTGGGIGRRHGRWARRVLHLHLRLLLLLLRLCRRCTGREGLGGDTGHLLHSRPGLLAQHFFLQRPHLGLDLGQVDVLLPEEGVHLALVLLCLLRVRHQLLQRSHGHLLLDRLQRVRPRSQRLKHLVVLPRRVNVAQGFFDVDEELVDFGEPDFEEFLLLEVEERLLLVLLLHEALGVLLGAHRLLLHLPLVLAQLPPLRLQRQDRLVHLTRLRLL
mmetsp:Transcript_4572/g.11551  ORF Transcript_4572/g.11551 Transcript_4572/m.11551 type:complete len:485 (+) Transcript_4572:1878-3332(+)